MTLPAIQNNNLAMPAVDQGAILRHLGINASDPAAQALILVCQRYDLDPILKHALLIQGRLYVTRDGLLHVAHRSGKFDGMEVVEQDETSTHFTAKVSVYRKDMGRPFTYIGRHPKGGRGPGAQYGPEMAVKVAEVMALRRAFDVALGAAEERWDEEAQREMQQADNATPVQVEKAQPAAQEPQEDPKVRAWLDKVASTEKRVRKIAPDEEVDVLVEGASIDSPVSFLKGVYEDLIEMGKRYTMPPLPAQPAPAESVGSDLMITAEQTKQLQTLARSVGADTPARRHAFWGHILGFDHGVPTKELTEEQADLIWDAVKDLDLDGRKQFYDEARRALLGGGV